MLAPFGGIVPDYSTLDAALCSLDHHIVEAIRGLPPRGAQVCSACRQRVADLARVLELASSQDVSEPPSTGRSGGSVAEVEASVR